MVKEYNTHATPELYAATTPLEGVKLVLSDAASSGDPETVVAIIDVRRAYFYAKAKRLIYVKLPPEDWEEGDEGRCGVLDFSLYGTRDAAQNWEEELGNLLTEAGLTRGKASPCLYRKEGSKLSASVWGDDVTAQGSNTDIMELIECL